MGDWGLISFRYDCEQKLKFPNEIRRVKGLISKAYKYPGVEGMLLHAYNGVKYFLEHYENKQLFYGLEKKDLEISEWAEFNTAFDIYWDYRKVDLGYDIVKEIVTQWDTTDEYKSDDKLQNDLFSCEGMYGWLLIGYISNLDGKHELKYGYFYNNEIRDMKGVLDEYASNHGISAEIPDYLKKIIMFFNDNAIVIKSKDEYWEMEKQGVELIREIMEDDNEC